MHPNVSALMSHPAVRAAMERYLASQGRGGDTMIAHLNPQEAATLHAMGGAGTRNPKTGLPEFYAGGAGAGGVGGADQGGMGAHPGSDGARGNSGGGGYGNASDGHSSTGSGAGAGGGHTGQNGYVNNYPYTTAPTGTSAPPPQVPVAPPAPPPPPVTLAPMMSTTATQNLTGGRFGALPAWDLKPYQVGTAPTSFPVPGIDTSAGAPGSASNPFSGGSPTGGGGAGGNPGAPAGNSHPMPALGTPAAIAAGLGTNSNGVPMQATADAYSPQQLGILAQFGITPDPVKHQLRLNKRAAQYGATTQDLPWPTLLQSPTAQPNSVSAKPNSVSAFPMLGGQQPAKAKQPQTMANPFGPLLGQTKKAPKKAVVPSNR